MIPIAIAEKTAIFGQVPDRFWSSDRTTDGAGIK
jgi:hypothetical protein